MNAVQSNIAPIENKKKLELSRQDQELLNKAKLLSRDPFIPDTHRGNVPACFSAVRMANKFDMDPMFVMQSMYFIHGKTGFSSTFFIACVNASKRFSTMQYIYKGEGNNRSCHVECIELATGNKIVSPAITMQMAIDEGWAGKKGSKWKTMPDIMLMYRSATIFARGHVSDLLLGIQSAEEIQDISNGPKHVHKVNTITDIEEMEEKQIDFSNENKE